MGRRTHREFLSSMHCGHNYQGFLKHHGEYKKRYYTCGGYVSKGREVCTCFSVPAQDVEDFALKEIRDRLTSRKIMDSIKSYVKTMLDEQEKAGNHNLAPLEAGVEQNRKQIQNLVAAIKDGRSFPALLDELAILEKEKTRLECGLAIERAKPVLKTDPEATTVKLQAVLTQQLQLTLTHPISKKARQCML